MTVRATGLLVVAATAAVLSMARESAAGVVIDGNEQAATRSCGGNAAVVNGNSNKLTLTDCSKLVLNGSRNVIDAGTVDTVSVFGDENRITWRGKVEPKIVAIGTNNDVVAAGAATGGAQVRREGGDGATRPSAAGKVTVISDSELTRTHDCAGGSVVVEGSENVLTLKNCAEIAIKGSENKITAVAPGTLKVLGVENQVTWSAGPDGKRPQIANMGSENTVSQK